MHRTTVAGSMAFAWLAACTAPEDGPAGLAERAGVSDKVEIWHRTGSGGVNILSVAPAAVRAHLAHGDWSNPIYVDASADLGGNGLAATPYRRLTDAIATASVMREATGDTEWATHPIWIIAAPGTYQGSYLQASLDTDPTLEALPLLLDVPGLVLQGSSVLALDADGLPTGGLADPSSLTRIVPRLASGTVPVERLGTNQALIVIAETLDAQGTAWAGNGTEVSGWVLDSGRVGLATGLGTAVYASRVSDVALRSTVVGPRFFNTLDTKTVTIAIDGLYSNGTSTCSLCLSAGEYDVVDSRIADGLLGVAVTPVGITPPPLLGTHADRTLVVPDLPPSASIRVRVEHCDLRHHTQNANIGSGVRLVTIGPETAAAVTDTTVDVVVRDTWFGDSAEGVLVDAGFPEWANPPTRGNPRLVDTTISASLEGNHWGSFTKAPLLVSFTRGQIATGGGAAAGNTPYVSDADWEIDLSGGDEAIAASAWIDHPVRDRYDPAPVDLLNTLVFDGTTIARGTCKGAFAPAICPVP